MKHKILNILTVSAAAVVCTYYAVYLIFCITGFDSVFMSLFALFVMACAGLPVYFRQWLRTKLGRAFKPLQIVFTVLLSVYIVTVMIFWCWIGLDAANTPESFLAEFDGTGDDTLILVFGCRAYGMIPSSALRLRLEAALELLQELPDAVCIVSGGQGSNETAPEGVVMKEWLISHGIDAPRIFIEQDSHSTSENVRFSKELVESLGFTDKRIIGVSTAFHLPRIELLSSRYGLPMTLVSAPSPTFANHYVSMVREYLSYIKMALFDQAVLITKIT